MKKKWINLLLFCLITLHSTAQTDGYTFYSQLDTIKKSGFYNIELGPALNAFIKTDYSDVRIVNESGKWIPHVLCNPAQEITNHPVQFDLKFTKTEIPAISTALIIENKLGTISNIGLGITNTEAERFCSLSGSNDQQNWFVINDSILINPSPSEEKTENIFTINFPPSDYRFFKVHINNKNKDPFLIKAVVCSSSADSPVNDKTKKIENPAVTVLQKDSGRISYIKITQRLPYQFDNITLEPGSVKYFNRRADLFVPDRADHSFSNPGDFLQSISISNNSTLQFNTPLSKGSNFYLLINNEDNLPLKVNAVKTFCNGRYLTAYLEAGVSYRLILGNESSVQPNYDLSNLNSKESDSIPFLLAAAPQPIPKNSIAESDSKENKWILWASIAAALLILVFFTGKMLKEIDKRKTV